MTRTQAERVKRRNFKRLRPDRRAEHHHHVYVVLLDSAAAALGKMRAENPTRDAHLNPMPFEAAAEMQRDLADDLRRAGYTVAGGHQQITNLLLYAYALITEDLNRGQDYGGNRVLDPFC